VIWVGWRQFRGQAVAAAAVVVAVAILLGITGYHLANLFSAYQANLHSCTALTCQGYQARVLTAYPRVRLVGTLLIAVPAVIGMFWGAPLVAREIETGTYRLAWTQSVTRHRWMLTKLALVGLASVVTTGLLSLAMTWWARPFDIINANHLTPGIFDQRGVVPMGYAAFAFALGVMCGLLIKRSLPAMAATLAGFIAVRAVIEFVIRPHLFAPLHKFFLLTPAAGVGIQLKNGVLSIQSAGASIHGGWVTGTSIVDAAGQPPSSAFLHRACAAVLSLPPPGGSSPRSQAPPGAQQAFTSCVRTVGARYHEVVAYQPNSRFWEFQWTELGIFLALALILGGACVALIGRRPA
jgi:hypothetical protein